MEAPVLIEAREQRLCVTLNRPEVLNAQNQPMRVALVEALDRFEADDELRVMIISGAGRAFSSGADIKELNELEGSTREARLAATRIHFDRLWQTEKPVIAAVHGYAVGGGFELAQMCDIRVASEDAQFGQPEPRTTGGLGSIAVRHLHHLIPRGEAMLIHLRARPISADRAYQIGLVQALAPTREEMLKEADAIADDVIACADASLRRIKSLVRAGVELSMAQQDVVSQALPPFRSEDRERRRNAFLRGADPADSGPGS
jgi:enoyl-CoA hydratase/carnithine racemase